METRTIGARNINIVKSLVKVAVSRGEKDVYSFVVGNIPEEMFNIWESAHDEIDRIISDNYNPHLRK